MAEAHSEPALGRATMDGKMTGKTPFAFRGIKWLLRSVMLFGKETVLQIDYNEGYNFNFEITEEEAQSLLPSNLRPLKLRLCREDDEPTYYLSWYLASMDTMKTDKEAQRVDLFTYCVNEDDELSLFFVSCIMEMPDYFEKNEWGKKFYLRVFDFFARDTETGGISYPHYFSERARADANSFVVELNDSVIATDHARRGGERHHWDMVFIMANSQIYRNSHDKNTNFFNQRFIDAEIKFVDLDNVETKNLEGFHPLCRNLKSIHFYGSKDKPSKWYIEL
ncbi:MAG: hypothetical protein JRE70_15350 [Deltaproteobacteria bacterium]|nr:hypothetical protein [Deltaproteobacteria bacterium]